ncbi:MAG TPA: hypothetical protein VHD33_05050, partial [Legionellaceae bacterium]|nr:hypothetical protein [Legionellaceae bacterium]
KQPNINSVSTNPSIPSPTINEALDDEFISLLENQLPATPSQKNKQPTITSSQKKQSNINSASTRPSITSPTSISGRTTPEFGSPHSIPTLRQPSTGYASNHGSYYRNKVDGLRNSGNFSDSELENSVVNDAPQETRNGKKIEEDIKSALDNINIDRAQYTTIIKNDAVMLKYKQKEVLQAQSDSVHVTKWKDPLLSREGKASIILKSLGIPPCPPSITISKPDSPLGQEIDKQFKELQKAEKNMNRGLGFSSR